MGAHAEHVVPGLRALADAVRAEGALLGVELNHSGRVAQASVSGVQPVAPSPVPCVTTGSEMPRELDGAEIGAIVRSFGDAARRCVAAGVDVLEVLAAHGYLIHQFLSPRTNLRTDAYGDPVLFLNEVRDPAPHVPLFVRLSEDVDGSDVPQGGRGGAGIGEVDHDVARGADVRRQDTMTLGGQTIDAAGSDPAPARPCLASRPPRR
jgi:2,4-dienoyl-CoA reductase-like NADH-dependent reductase (Old Yellow Enzyme family)